MTEKLFKFRWDMRRSADIVSTFIATQEEVDAAIGGQVDFGEIAGKHSGVMGTLDAADLTVVTADPADIEVLQRLGLGSQGHNPLQYLICKECGDPMNETACTPLNCTEAGEADDD